MGCGPGRRRECFDGIARELQVSLGIGHVDGQIAHPLDAHPLADHPPRKTQSALEQIAFTEGVEQGRAAQFLRSHRRTRNDHVQGGLHAEQSRQPLCAAGSGQKPELDLGQRDSRARHADPVVASQGKLQTSAHAHAADRRDHGFAAVFYDAQNRGQDGVGRRLGGAEFTDIGSAGKTGRRADQQQRAYGGIRVRARHLGNQGHAQLVAETVDRRMIECKNGHAVRDRETDYSHAGPQFD